MPNPRTTSRGFLSGASTPLLAGAVALLAALVTALPAAAHDTKRAAGQSRSARTAGVPQLVFPLAVAAQFRDDFGEPRARWSHPGNDLVAPKRSQVLAVEAGTVGFYTRSASAGCMLYLYGDSGTTYQYVHLNNDLGAGNDNRGGCVAGVAWAPGLRDGQRVTAGQHIGYLGDSGDASGGGAHLHFEVHPGGGAAVSPYPYLMAAKRPGAAAAVPPAPLSGY